MLFIGIDLGASFIKGAVLDLEALCLRHIHRVPFPGFISGLPPLHREVDPIEIIAAVRRLIHQLLPYAPKCSGIVMCSQMHGLVLMTARGEPLSNFISWQDQRALIRHPSDRGSFFDILSQRINSMERRQLGNELRAGLPVCFLFWLAENKQLPQSDAIPASLPDFVIANLCGSFSGIEPTNAAAHGAFNLDTFNWHYDVISKLGLGGLRWPTLQGFGEVVGFLRVNSTLLPCYTPVGDQQCALVGACLGYEDLSFNIATGSQVSLLTSQREFGDYQTRPFFDGRFLKTVTHIPAGRSLNLLINLLVELAEAQGVKLQDPWTYIARAVAEADETDLHVDLAFFSSVFGNRGEISNIHEGNLTVGHLFRAAFQNMADNYYECALRLSPHKAWQKIVFSGGLAQKLETLRNVICRRFIIDYRISPSSEDTLLGLLALSLVLSGKFYSVQEVTAELMQRYSDDGGLTSLNEGGA